MKFKICIANGIFLAAFFFIVISGLIGFNFEKQAVSLIDNRYLAEFPTEWNQNATSEIDQYMQDRIGFREPMISLYSNLNFHIFHLAPDTIWGKDGELFGNGADYIASYQHLDGDPEYADLFVSYLKSLQQLCQSKSISFFYMQCPDKTSVYPEYMPDTIHIAPWENLTELIQERIITEQIPHVFLDETLQAAKPNRVFTQKFDVAHWSDIGRYYGVNALLTEISKEYSSVTPLEQCDFSIGTVLAEKQIVSAIYINETLPTYQMNQPNSFYEDTSYNANLQIVPNTYFSRFLNAKNLEGPKLLMLCDSYMGGYQDYYLSAFSEVVQVHAYNANKLQYFINLFEPDIVVFENVERAMPDFYPKDFLRTFSIIPPYQSDEWLVIDTDVPLVTIQLIDDTPVEDELIFDNTIPIQKISGLALLRDQQPGQMVYAKINGKYYEPMFYQDGSFEFSFTNEQLHLSTELEILCVSESGSVSKKLYTYEMID